MTDQELSTLPVLSADELERLTEGAYQRARFERANQTEALTRGLRRAQWANLVLLLLVAALAAGVLYHARRTRIIPYVVEVDRHGRTVAVGPATEVIEPDRRMITHVLTLWVSRTRTVTLDAAIQRRELLSAYEYTAGRAVNLLNGWFRQHPPFARSETETVTVTVDDVESLLALDSSMERWRIAWTEQVRSRSGALVREELWQAIVTVEVDPPERIEQVLTNPLGIRVTDFDWTQTSTRTP